MIRPLAVALMCCAAGPAGAGSESGIGIHLLDIHLGSHRSDIVQGMRSGGYELADGKPVSFDGWYRPHHPEITILFLSQLSDHVGLTWGLSTGGDGKKYTIDPALHLGLTWQADLSPRSTLTLGLQTVWGGHLQERSCSADYGPFGMAEVNCRLAATEMPPAETLRYLANVRGDGDNRITLRFDHWF